MTRERKKCALILIGSDVGLYRFRKELPLELLHPGSYLPERAQEEPWEVCIALPQGPFIPQLEEMGCRFIDVSVNRRGTNFLEDFRLLRTYLRIIREVRPDVVLTFNIKPNVYGGMACRMAGVPYLTNITGLGTSVETPGMLQKMVLTIYRIGTAGATCTYFQNRSNMDFMHRHCVGGGEQCLLPGSGVDLEAHSCQPYPDEAQGIRFLSIMRVMRDKGIGELLECVEKVKARYPQVSFSLAGSYEEECYREPIERAQREGKLNYLGFRQDIDELMTQHHCVIHPSYHEGLSNVLLEAAACGRPVIASNVPGCVETFDEGVSGFGFESKKSDSLVASVEHFIQLSLQQREQMGKAGRMKVEAEFNRKNVVRAYVTQLETITQNHP